MNIFQINDCDWWIGESLDACIGDNIGDYCEDPHELTDTELDSLIFTADDGKKRTFREQLAVEIEVGGEFPRMFLSIGTYDLRASVDQEVARIGYETQLLTDIRHLADEFDAWERSVMNYDLVKVGPYGKH